jgi:glutathione S-transferase
LIIADIAIFMYAHSAKWCGIDVQEYPHVKAWHDKLAQRPGFQKGLQVPVPYQFSDEAECNPETQDTYRGLRKGASQMFKEVTDQLEGKVVPLPSDHANYE